jgi:hypothetical protein
MVVTLTSLYFPSLSSTLNLYVLFKLKAKSLLTSAAVYTGIPSISFMVSPNLSPACAAGLSALIFIINEPN